MKLNYQHLYYFYCIARHEGISRAAGVLKLGQPTLSLQLQQFEKSLDMQLFERQGKRLILTHQGRYVLSFAQDIFERGQEFLDDYKKFSHQKERPRLHIGISSFVPRAFVDAFIRFLLQQQNNLYINVQQSDAANMMELLKTNLLDMVLTDSLMDLDPAIDCRIVARVPIVLCAHRNLARQYKKFPADLDGAPIILPTAHSQVHKSLQDYWLRHQIKPRVIAEIQDVEVVRRLALSQMGIAALNLFTVKNAPSKEPLKVLHIPKNPTIFDNLYLFGKLKSSRSNLLKAAFKKFHLHMQNISPSGI